ncbi:MAG: hypothetical protein KDD39_01915 [Bdellovibrionales bacterium]|nr:hypothetical protein [Bdellovibrionales bacterium]
MVCARTSPRPMASYFQVVPVADGKPLNSYYDYTIEDCNAGLKGSKNGNYCAFSGRYGGRKGWFLFDDHGKILSGHYLDLSKCIRKRDE